MKSFILALTAFLIFSCFVYTYNLNQRPLPTEFTQAELYSAQTHDDLKATIVDSIRRANRSVLLIIFSLRDSDVIAELRNKAAEGVTVTVICDAKASREVKEALCNQVDLLRRFSDGHMHPKILVVDDKRIWIGSANMTTDSLKHHANLITELESPELAATIWNYGNSLKEYGKESVCSYCRQEVNGQEVEMSFLPGDRKGNERIKQMLRSAQKTIRVGMYTFTRFDFARELISAKNRGVSVEVALDRGMAKGAGSKIATLLRKEGIPVRLNDGKYLLHHKFAYIDSKCLINGSANWTKAAFTQNDDCFIILHDLNTRQMSQMDHLWERIMQETTIE